MNDFEIIKKLKGGSFSSTAVIDIPGLGKRVRKSISRCEEREYGLVRWQSQVRRMQHLQTVLPNNTPQVLNMGTSGSNFFYDIPYYESSQNLYEYLSERGSVEAGEIFDQIISLMDVCKKTKYGNVTGSFNVFLCEEVIGRLMNIDARLEDLCLNSKITVAEAKYVRDRIDIVFPILEKVVLESKHWVIEESLTHGNLTLENALYNHETQSIILIDPYSETYCESTLGDISQLMQSSVSFYEYFVSQGETNVDEYFKISAKENINGVYHFGKLIIDYVSGLTVHEKKLVMLFHASQFFRMFPFKIKKTPRLAIYFLLHGIEIIKSGISDA